jgi:hypothetical protein
MMRLAHQMLLESYDGRGLFIDRPVARCNKISTLSNEDQEKIKDKESKVR